MKQDIVESVYPERYFGGYSRVDGTVEFYSRVQALLRSDDKVLDIGCGRGKDAEDACQLRRRLCDLRGENRHVVGIDVDPVGDSNPLINEFHPISDVNNWPVGSGQFDLAVSNSVIEHVEHPELFFQEAWRVLKPGGYLCIRTYNVWNYVGIAARLIPNKYHAAVTGKVQGSREEEDVFPTLYRCNTRRKVQRALEAQGFKAYVYTFQAEPSYLRFSRIAYRIGAVAHKLMPSPLRWAILAYAQKPSQQGIRE